MNPPQPNAAHPNSPTNNFSQSLTQINPQQKFDVKGDFGLVGQDRIFARVSYQRNDLTARGPTRFENVGENATPRDHNDAVGYSHFFSPEAVNELRFGFNRFWTYHFGNDLGIPRCLHSKTRCGKTRTRWVVGQFQFSAAFALRSFQRVS